MGHLEMVKVLIGHGASVDKPRKDGATPLTISAQKGCLGIVKNLLQNGAKVFVLLYHAFFCLTSTVRLTLADAGCHEFANHQKVMHSILQLS
jgi:ankyrin repeat protein